ncbi:alpha/beta hydrolase [Nocardioides sp. cx-169]|uniref:alpha/beta hydrolase family protein n=1 Tax=Nocardioides sp. cx-169 TaxID=2899080 RepID=UPI001E61583F|nr:alpha/beta hydrolase [Nocardioides sp. cx-169]MCD4533419.1 alpha/beta hydrolase [Nocardioides sp. cx-169]
MSEPEGRAEGRLDYGSDPSQYGELSLPEGDPRGVVVVIHGGFWKAAYDASLGRPLAAALVARGWAAWNLEYRRVGAGGGAGGGAPATFDDVAAGIDHLAGLGLDLTTVVALGHSAGGHLAAWAATRGRDGWPQRVPVTAVVSQAGVLDLRSADADGLGDGAVRALLGHAATAADAPYDPIQRVPAGVPVWCVHGRDDDVVPPSQSAAYVQAARAAGGEAELVEVDGDHFVVIDPDSPAWTRIVGILDTLG